MAIDIELAGLKAAGTYRFERDLSALSSNVLAESYSNLRLIVGFSKKGPFNSAQLITSSSQFIKLYGNIDRSLEKRGSYFHRSALVALTVGPILCLNLLSLDPERDQVMHRSISTSINKSNKDIRTIPYQTVYNTDKFWQLSSESYLDSVHKFDKTVENGNNNILNFTNVGNKPISVIVKKAGEKNIKGYDITLKEWYGAENVPEHFNGSSFVSDYMVEVYVVSGNFGPDMSKVEKEIANDDGNSFTKIYNYSFDDVFGENATDATNPYKRFASDITYQGYFDKYGFKADKLNKFLSLPSVNVIATYVGSLIPNFTNKLNQNIWIEDLINKDTLSTGLLCTEDIDMIEKVDIDEDGIVNEAIDIIGHNFHLLPTAMQSQSINFLSYAISQDKIDELDDDNSENENLTYKGEIEIHYPKLRNEYYISVDGVPLNIDANNELIIDSIDFKENKIKVGDMLLSHIGYKNADSTDIEFSRLTRVVEIKPLYKKDVDGYKKDPNHYRVICADKVEVCYDIIDGEEKDDTAHVVKYTTIDNICDRYHWTYLQGFKVSEDAMPNGDNGRQNEILSMISENNVNSNLYKALIDRDYVQWRYVVDTFGLGIESECKKVYGLLCKGRQSGLAIINAPSMKDFKKSPDPSFVDAFGSVKAEYISTGGNLDKAPANLFSLPKEENGASWSA